MKTKSVQGVEVHQSSGNVFADLGLADADKLFVACAIRSKVFWRGWPAA